MLKEYNPIDLAVRAYAAMLEENPQPTTTLMNQDTVVFVIQTDRVYMMLPEGRSLLMGRHHASNIMQPDLDLSVYDAEAAGMSRLHAALKHEANGWWLTDMNSSNGTWVDGERLMPFVPRLLSQNNHLFLGKLELIVTLPEPQALVA